MTFYVGQKVECVGFKKTTWGDRWYCWRHPPPGGDIKKGEVYTVAGVHLDPEAEYDELNVELFEIHSPGDEWWCAGFFASCFRPLCNKPTSIEVFEKILAPHRESETTR